MGGHVINAAAQRWRMRGGHVDKVLGLAEAEAGSQQWSRHRCQTMLGLSAVVATVVDAWAGVVVVVQSDIEITGTGTNGRWHTLP